MFEKGRVSRSGGVPSAEAHVDPVWPGSPPSNGPLHDPLWDVVVGDAPLDVWPHDPPPAEWLTDAVPPPEAPYLRAEPTAGSPHGQRSGSDPSGWLALELDHHTTDSARLSDAELIDGIVAWERLAAWAQARQARLLAELARRRPADDAAASRSNTASACVGFAADEVSLALRLSRTTASARLAMARTVVEELPGTLELWQQGRLDALKVRAVTETACTLPADRYPALETRVLPRAPEQTTAQLRAALSRAVLAIDPDGAHDRHQQRRSDRRVVISQEGDGMASLWALLPAPEATAAYQRLSHLARGLGASDPRGMDARRADLLADLLTGTRCAATAIAPPAARVTTTVPPVHAPIAAPATTAAGTTAAGAGRATTAAGASCDTVAAGETTATGARHGTATAADLVTSTGPPTVGHQPRTADGHDCRPSGPRKPLVHVIVPVTMLMGLDDQAGELVGHGPIPAALAREIAAGGTWRRLLTDPASGVLLDHGSTTYAPPAALADHVRARDVHCRFPTCRQPAARADLDHAVPYPEGRTSAGNLHAACRHHHRGKTRNRWHVTQQDDGRITYATPTGHTYPSSPHDYRPDAVPAHL